MQGTLRCPADGSEVAGVTWKIDWKQWVQMDDNLSCLVKGAAKEQSAGGAVDENLPASDSKARVVDCAKVCARADTGPADGVRGVSLEDKLLEVVGLVDNYVAVTLQELIKLLSSSSSS